MSKVKNALKKILSIGAIDTVNGKQETKVSRITNKILYKKLVDHFNEQMEELSVGRRLLFPMSYNILMHPDDYNKTKETLPFVLPEVVSAFYASIKTQSSTYHNGVNFQPTATYWFFQFSACDVGFQQNGEDEYIQRGDISILATTYSGVDLKNIQQNNISIEGNSYYSVRKPGMNSSSTATNINMDALLGMEILGESSFIFYFDKTLNEDTSIITMESTLQGLSGIQRKGFASLRWIDESGDGYHEMIDNYIDISGKSDLRITRNIVKIQSDAVAVSHVQIRYDHDSHTFALAAFAKTRLNSREVPLSMTGSAPQWIPLADNSKIFLNDTINIKFSVNKDMA